MLFASILLFKLIVLSRVRAEISDFTCQGSTYAVALSNCPDKGAQRFSSGGNVTVLVRSANNLPDRDIFGANSGVSDPFVKFTVGKNLHFNSKFIDNDLNPVWNEKVSLGVLGSATEIKVTIMDYDMGLEYTSDPLVSTTMRVPFCSTFSATYAEKLCSTPFNCAADDSLWQMPVRQVCHEYGEISMNNIPCDSPGAICLKLDFFIVPFTMEVELEARNMTTRTPLLSAAGNFFNEVAWTVDNRFSFPYIGLTTDRFDFRTSQFDTLEGALMFRTDYNDRSLGYENQIRFYASANLPATLYVCRNVLDNEKGVPSWIDSEYNGRNQTVTQMSYFDQPVVFGCWYNEIPGTRKNRWGGIVSDYLTFRSNTVEGLDSSLASYEDNYVILAVPRVLVKPYQDLSIYYSSSPFITNLFSMGLMWFYFTYIIVVFMRKIKYRVDRVETYLSTAMYTGDNKSVIATLFLNAGTSPCNVEYRSHLFHARNAIWFILSMPFWLLLSWGIVSIATVEPAAIGYGLIFIGSAMLLFWSAMRLWENQRWHMSSATLIQILLSVMLFICFIISIIFSDPSVFRYGNAINLPALSLAFATINTFPLLLLMFQRDKAYKVNLKIVTERMTSTLLSIKTAAKGEKSGNKKLSSSTAATPKALSINTALHALLKDGYTINPKVPLFSFATVLMDTNTSLKDEENKKKFGNMLYNVSLFVLFIFLMIGISRTDYPSLCFLHCLVFLMLDCVHTSVSHGDIDWTAGYHIALLVAGRLLVASSSPSLWILHYSGAYLVYSFALVQEMLNAFLPYVTKEQAGDIAFAGKDTLLKSNPDVAGSSAYSLGSLTFAFVSLIMVSAYSGNDALPISKVNVWGTDWATYVFGLIAFLVVITGGLIVGTFRAFYLQKHGLLRGYARECYLFNPKFRLHHILAMFSEIAIISSGILIYGATGASAVLTSAIFFPPIFACFGYTYKVWLSNDYDLIVWPPVEKPPANVDDTPTELEIAYHMMDNMFGEKTDELLIEENPETEEVAPKNKTLKDFKLPPMDATGNNADKLQAIKMPALPLKSALRKKRVQMGIETNGSPLVDDLKLREGADGDRFGTADIIDADDPWARYEEEEVENDSDDMLKSKQIIAKNKKEADASRRGFLNHPYIVKAKEAFMATTLGKIIYDQVTMCFKFFVTHASKYAKIDLGKEKEFDENGDEIKHAEEDEEEKVGVEHMLFWDAVIGGFLTHEEYYALGAWFGGFFLTMIYGIVLSKTTSPEWMGHVIWMATWIFIITIVPMVKYFHTYVIDDTIKLFAKIGAFLHFMFSLTFFLAALDGNVGISASLCVLDYFFYYPVFVYVSYEAYKWMDDGWILIPLDKDGDGSVTTKEYLMFFKAYPLIVSMFILMIFQCYVWVGTITGNVSLLLFLLYTIGYMFARDWSANDFFLSSELAKAGDIIIRFILYLTFLISLFYPENPIFPLSLFFFVLVFRCITNIIARYIVFEPDTIFYVSPFIFPVYSYDSKKSDLVDESGFVKQILTTLIAGALWGAFMGMFIYPVNYGICIACIFLLIIASIVAAAVSYVPIQLGRLALMMSPEALEAAANAASETFNERKQPLNLDIIGWDENENIYAVKANKEVKPVTAIMLATELIDDSRSLEYVHLDMKARMKKIVQDEEDIEDMPWRRRYWRKFLEFYKMCMKLLFPVDKLKDFQRHKEASFTAKDMVAEAVLTGRGPFGFLGAEGLWYRLFKYVQTQPRLRFLQQPWLNVYDENGNSTTAVSLSESLDIPRLLSRLGEEDVALNNIIHEEIRCAAHFLLMTIVAADAKLQREKILFQKFLRENKFRLASNGISPPSEIFTSSSYASVDIPLVAVWLSTLSSEERERFHLLKATFSEEQRVRDEAIDSDDYKESFLAKNVLKSRENRNMDMFQKLSREILIRQNERIRALVERLTITERSVFMLYKDEWTSNSDCIVSEHHQELYEKFRTAVMHCEDEATEYARQVLADVEAGTKDCRVGEYGRNYQFFDSEFLPGETSIGDSESRSLISGWKCAPAICETSQLFETGTDPDDVEMGVFKTGWILSALSMLAAAGGIGDGGVDEQILNLFVGHYAIDGQITYSTEVGGYCVRLYKNGIWFPIILDDVFPMLAEGSGTWTNENKGMAGGHSKECQELWVSLVEKAFAKYYGSYGLIETGYVPHALEDLTGCEAECIYLNEASRGSQKRVLWDMMLRYRKNGYILGAGTGSSGLADKAILDMGIVFDAAYTVYDVRNIDGYQLIKLRNPPGDHDEWKGDWSDDSKLWTRRLKHKLKWTSTNDNTFWMCFDDFCNVFRNLYICKWYDQHKWQKQVLSGAWIVPKEPEVEKLKKKKSKAYDDDFDMGLNDEEVVPEAVKEIVPQADTSGGLPSRHNPGCILENNPYYSLKIHRPTDIRLTLCQTDSRGVATHDPVHAAIFICNSSHPKVALRMKSLNRDDVIAYSGEAQAVREQHLYATLKPGIYVVLVATYVKGMTGNFTLTMLSNYKSKMGQIWPPVWLQNGQKFNTNALLDGPDTQESEIPFVTKAVDAIKAGISALMGTGTDEKEESEKENDGENFMEMENEEEVAKNKMQNDENV